MSLYSKDELRAKGEEIIDEAVAATEREDKSHKEAYREQRQESGDYTGGPGESSFAHGDDLEALKEWVREELSWIPDSLYEMGDPEPSGFDDIIEATRATSEIFLAGDEGSGDPRFGYVDKAQAEMEEWDGAFSEGFQNGFSTPFSVIMQNQGKVGKNIYEAAQATQALYKEKRKNVSEMCDLTISALKACGERDGGDEKLALTILGAVAIVGSAALSVPTFGLSTAGIAYGSLALSGVIAGTGVANGHEVLEPAKEEELGAPTVNEVISNMISRMSDINTDISDKEQEVCKALDANFEILTSMRSIANAEKAPSPLTPLRPKIADADDPASGLTPD